MNCGLPSLALSDVGAAKPMRLLSTSYVVRVTKKLTFDILFILN